MGAQTAADSINPGFLSNLSNEKLREIVKDCGFKGLVRVIGSGYVNACRYRQSCSRRVL
jgi:hypothetical protein